MDLHLQSAMGGVLRSVVVSPSRRIDRTPLERLEKLMGRTQHGVQIGAGVGGVTVMRGLGVLAASCCPSDVQGAPPGERGGGMDTAGAVLRHHSDRRIRARRDELGISWEKTRPPEEIDMSDGGDYAADRKSDTHRGRYDVGFGGLAEE